MWCTIHVAKYKPHQNPTTPHPPPPPSLLTQEAKEKEDVCADENTDKYLNKKDVQKALHAQLVGIDKWSLCSK